jgi:hypothetical protein
MQNNKKSSTSRSRRVLSVDETTTALTAEQEREESAESLPQGGESATFENRKQWETRVRKQRRTTFSNDILSIFIG